MKSNKVLLITGSVFIFTIAVSGIYWFLYSQDQKTANCSLSMMIQAKASDINILDQNYSKAKSQLLRIRNKKLKENALSEIQEIYDKKKQKIDIANQITTESLSKISQNFSKISDLENAYIEAKSMILKIEIPEKSEKATKLINDIYKKRKENIEAAERRLAEERQRQERLRIENEKRLAEERQRQKQLQIEREKLAATERLIREQEERLRRERENPMCCCKLEKYKWVDPGGWKSYVWRYDTSYYKWIKADDCSGISKNVPLFGTGWKTVRKCSSKSNCGR